MLARMSGVVLITGASSGIGKETALLFQAKNWRVAAAMRSPEDQPELQKIADLFCVRMDVTDSSSVDSAVASVIERFGGIDAVVNNAGYALAGPFEAADESQIARQFDVNVFGLMNVCRTLIPHFRERKRGVIVNVASIGGRAAFPFYSLYNSTKWAVEGFSESLQYELEPFNVKVKIIEPGPIKTDFYGRSEDVAAREGLHFYDHFLEKARAAMKKAGETAPDGVVVANTIYDAVTDSSKRLRYGVNTKGLLAAKAVLPESAFRQLVKMIFLR